MGQNNNMSLISKDSCHFDPFQPPVNIFLEFLYNEFKSVKGRQYSSMNSMRSAISTIAIIDSKPAG